MLPQDTYQIPSLEKSERLPVMVPHPCLGFVGRQISITWAWRQLHSQTLLAWSVFVGAPWIWILNDTRYVQRIPHRVVAVSPHVCINPMNPMNPMLMIPRPLSDFLTSRTPMRQLFQSLNQPLLGWSLSIWQSYWFSLISYAWSHASGWRVYEYTQRTPGTLAWRLQHKLQ